MRRKRWVPLVLIWLGVIWLVQISMAQAGGHHGVREYYHPALPDVYESYCVGSPPCDRNNNCGVIYNYRGKASEIVTVRDCEVWLDISC